VPVDIMMRGQLNPVVVKGNFEKLLNDINMQMVQGRQLIAVQSPDDLPIAINVNNINTMKPQSMESAFFSHDEE
jgi:hypothetical protein